MFIIVFTKLLVSVLQPYLIATDLFDKFFYVLPGKVVSVMLTARELVDPMFLDAINSLLVSGEYAHIFSIIVYKHDC